MRPTSPAPAASRSLSATLGLALVLAAHHAAAQSAPAIPAEPAEPPSPWAAQREGQRLSLCRDHQRLVNARGAVERFEQSLHAARPDGDVAPLLGELRALLAGPCFALTSERANHFPDARTVRSLQAWWDGGGMWWVSSFLHSDVPHATFTLVTPADPRPEWSLDDHRSDPVAPILCARADARCGQETRGWLQRALEATRRHARDQLQRDRAEATATNRLPDAASCARHAAALPATQRFRDFARCIDSATLTGMAPPLGPFRAPSSGWFVLRGARGHIRFCDELRLYDLATGAAWIAASCAGMALRSDGSFDLTPRDWTPVLTVTTGRVPVDNLREAALVALLHGASANVAWIESAFTRLPRAIEPRAVVRRESSATSATSAVWATSAQTSQAYVWIDGVTVRHSGALTWPDSSDAMEDHFDHLLRVAEDGFAEGCAPAALPTLPRTPARPDAAALDSVVPPGDALWDALDHARSRACRSTTSRPTRE